LTCRQTGSFSLIESFSIVAFLDKKLKTIEYEYFANSSTASCVSKIGSGLLDHSEKGIDFVVDRSKDKR